MGSFDRMSSLPDELLANVLSFLPTLGAVQTSILSSRWRHLFTLTRDLSFDDREYFGTAIIAQCEERKMSFERFVYGVLALHRISPIHKFKVILESTLKYDCSHLVVWILKGVQHLDLRIGNHPNALPSCILNCQTLTVLKIYTTTFRRFEYDLSVPAVVCLPNLGTLKLHRIRFLDGDSANRFFVGCSRLKVLYLHFCLFTTDHVRVSAKELRKLSIVGCSGHAVIDAPNLASLTYACSSSSTGVGVKNLRSLHSIEVWPILCPSHLKFCMILLEAPVKSEN
ncbi:hypothetical protein RND81_06G153000 [Saponaria officinalis]|uniref:F-box domain-containing protein n=1 Tax=Saponaria officinalis TaxID=3572 RepID=A0AAW1K6N2_SAPOF